MALGQLIRKKRESLGYTLDEVSAAIGFSKPYLSTVETGKLKNPPSDRCLGKLEQFLSFEPGLLRHIAHIERMPADIRSDYEDIDAQNRQYRRIIRNIIENKADLGSLGDLIDVESLSEDRESVTAGAVVPVINRVSAGYPADFDDLGYPAGYADDYVRCPDLHDSNMFAVRVVGDSMEPRFYEGDIVVFSPAARVENGDDCFVRFSEPHEATFKRVFFEDGGNVRLQPRNDRYGPLIVKGGRINGMYRAVIRYERL
jgi:SOS-response transcriptional repressor LexA